MTCKHLASVLAVAVGLVGGASIASAESSATAIIPSSTALRHGLKRPLMAQVDLDGARAKIADITYQDGTLLVQTDHAMLHCIDAETGKTLWATQVGATGHPALAAAANDVLVAAVNGTNLFLLDRKSGKVVHKQPLGSSPTAGPTLGGEYVYVPTANGKIEAYPYSTDMKLDSYTISGSGKATAPAIVTPQNIAWTTNNGHLLVHRLDNRKLRFDIDLGSPIASAPIYRGGIFYVAASNGQVYAVNESTGSIQWQFSTGDRMREGPAVVKDATYLVPEDGGLFRVTTANGAEQWFTPGIRKFLAASPSRVYAIDRLGRLAILDARNGAPLDTVPLSDKLSVLMANSKSDRVFLATEQGLIQSLHEVELKTPLRYIEVADVAEKPAEKASAKKAADAATLTPKVGPSSSPSTPVEKKEPVVRTPKEKPEKKVKEPKPKPEKKTPAAKK